MNNSSSNIIQEVDGYPNYPALGHYVNGCVLFMTMTFGALLNGTGLLTFIKNKQLQSPTNIFIISLLLGDFCMAALGTPMAMISSFNKYWYFGTLGCNIEGFMVYFFGMANLYSLCGISMDRYVVIAKPLQSSKITHRVALLSVFLCWFWGFFWAFVPFLGWSYYHLEAAHTSCSVVWESDDPIVISYNMTIFVFCFILPVFLMLFAYYHVFMTIKSVSRNTVWDMNSRVARRNLRIEKKMARTIFMMIGMYLFAWSPYAIVSFWAAFGDAKSIPMLVTTVPPILAKSSSVFNPLIYVATNKQFRMAFYGMIPCDGFKESLIKREEAKDEEESDDDGNETKNDKKAPAAQKITMVAPAPNPKDAEEVTQIEHLPPSPTAEGATGGNSMA